MSLNRILFQNEACLAVNKFKGEAVEGAKDGIKNLPYELMKNLNEKPELLEAVNRLDVPVTGCALFALKKDSLIFLNNIFSLENGAVKKSYWAVIEKPSFNMPESGELTHLIETDTKKNKSTAREVSPQAAHEKRIQKSKKASLKYRVTGEGVNYLFMEIELLSGRHHQIRAQLAAMDLHIKGDLKYGAKRSERSGGIRLHARELSFPNPLMKNEIIRVTADPPEIDNLWKEFFNRAL